MPKIRRRRGGGAETPVDNSDDSLLLIGGGLLFFIVAGVLIYYFLVKEKDSNEENEEENEEEESDGLKCDTLSEDCPENYVLNETKNCGDKCTIEKCCKERTCRAPGFVPDGYIVDEVTWSKNLKFSDFQGDYVKNSAIDTSKMSCDTANDYSGTPNIKRCPTGNGDDDWEFIGCNDQLEQCTTGKNPDDGGHPYTAGRSPTANCEQDIELSVFDTIEEEYLKCDKKYQNDGKFCKLIDDVNNNCREGAKCRKPQLRVISEVVTR